MSRAFFCGEPRVDKAIQINLHLSWVYHQKFPTVEKDEFVSIGYVAIAECLKAWSRKREGKRNFEAYLKTALQNRYRNYLNRQECKRQVIESMLTRVSKRLCYTSVYTEHEGNLTALPGARSRPPEEG